MHIIRQRAAVRTPIVIVMAIAITMALLLAPLLTWGDVGGKASATSAIAPRGIVVVGDSITARYNDTPGDASQGWWSMVGRHYDASVKTYAQSGSGYLRPGWKCAGDRFVDRWGAFTVGAPSLLIVEGGRNDWSECRNGRFVAAPDEMIEHAIDAYLNTLRTFLPQSTRIVVMGPPWGPVDPETGVRVTAIIESVAKRHGLEFISMDGSLTQARVLDGIHPNRQGSAAIAQRVIEALG